MTKIFNALRAAICTVAFAVTAMAAPTDVELFQKLSALAEKGSAKAQYNLGMLYNNGIGTKRDPQRAFTWFERSAAAGDPLASFKVACYYDGQFPGVVPVNYEKALTANLVAAQAGYFRAQQEVGNAYASKNSFKEATRWWAAAAEQGDAQSLVNLSEAYRRGLSVPQNAEKALELTLIASRLAQEEQSTQIKSRIDSLKKTTTSEQASQAEQAAKAWTPKLSSLSIRASLGITEAQKLVQ